MFTEWDCSKRMKGKLQRERQEKTAPNCNTKQTALPHLYHEILTKDAETGVPGVSTVILERKHLACVL